MPIGDSHFKIEVANRLADLADLERTGTWGGDEFLVALLIVITPRLMSIASAMMTKR